MVEHRESDEMGEPTGGAQYRFATGFTVTQPQTMVYLEFVQRDPVDGTSRGLARIVMLPAVADDLVEKLSELRKPSTE